MAVPYCGFRSLPISSCNAALENTRWKQAVLPSDPSCSSVMARGGALKGEVKMALSSSVRSFILIVPLLDCDAVIWSSGSQCAMAVLTIAIYSLLC